MTDTLLERHAEALRLFGERVRDVRGDQWGAPTPCTEWNVRELVNHVTAEQLWIPPLVSEGRTVEELAGSFSGDVLGEDPVAAWDRASAAAHAAFAASGALDRTVRLSYGPALGSAYCSELTADCVVHTWTSPGASAPATGCPTASSSSRSRRSCRTPTDWRPVVPTPSRWRSRRARTRRPGSSRWWGGRADAPSRPPAQQAYSPK